MSSPIVAKRKLNRTAPQPMQLELRFMFDGAAVVDLLNEASKTGLDPALDHALDVQPAAIEAPALFQTQVNDPVLQTAITAAQQSVRDFINQADDQTLFSLFNGGQSEPDAQWSQRLADLRAAINDGSFQVNVLEMEGASVATSIAAYTHAGPDGRPTVFINRFWFDLFEGTDATKALVEEFGHAMDDYLNPNADTAGDEGESFAAQALGLSLSARSLENDQGTVTFNGQVYQVEFASYNFVNAYQMVYDLNNNTNTLGVVNGAIDTNERWAAKEQNSHYFNTASLGAVTVDDDNYNSRYFSGNDVSAIGINIGGQTYYGWISRPIKSGGVVRGMYFWTDTSFTNLSLAQADGNQDADGYVLDNKGFLLVVDQSWFTTQIASGTSYTINNAKDGNLGTITVAHVGSSSDRVDSALNALVDSNVAPTAVADTSASTGATAAVESGYRYSAGNIVVSGTNGSGNVITDGTDDSDPNGDTLTVTKIGTNSANQVSVASGTTSANGTAVTGRYGTLTIGANGSYVYVVDNSNATVNAMLVGGSVTDAFTYTISDSKGGTASTTVTITINGTDDAPIAADDYNTAKEITTTSNTGYNATGNVLTNDTDVDTGDGKTISGASVSGSATSSAVTVTAGGSELIFLGSQGFTSVNGGEELYVLLSGSAGNSATYHGVYNLSGSTYSLVYVSSKTAVSGDDKITLNANATHYWNGTSYVAITSLSSFFSTYSNVLFENSTTQTENGTGGKQATVSSTATSGYTTLSGLSAQSGTIAVGMTVTGTGVPSGTTVSDITLTSGVITSIKLSSDQVTSTNGTTFTFTGSSGTGVTLTGAHGSVVINSNGSYTYTPTTDNAKLSSGDSAVEIFDYTMQDTAGVTSSAKLYITVYGSGSNDPGVTADSVDVYESGVGRTQDAPATTTSDNTTFLGQNVSTSATTGTSSVAKTITYNVLSNDTSTGKRVTDYTKADGSSSTSTGSVLTGTYGDLTITSGTSGGAVTYTLDNTNTTVNALLPGATLTETFRYKVTNDAGGINWSTLTITINGTNDGPVAVADTGSLSEDGTITATGNVLTNDTDVDTGDTKTVNKAGTSSASTSVTSGTTSANGLAVTGTYGTLTIGADGTYSYALANSSSAVQNLAAGATVTDVFRYEVIDANGATSTTTITFTITGANEPPINNYNGTAISSTATTSVTTALNTALVFSSTNSKQLSVGDADTNLSSITLTVENGTLDFTSTPSVVTLSASSGSTITISAGTQAELNAALSLLRYTPTTGFTGTDFLTIASKDSSNAWDTDGIAITVPKTWTGPTVLESDLSSGSNAAGTGESANVTLTAPTNQNFGTSDQSGTDTYGTWTLTTGGVFTYTLTSAPNSAGSSVTRSIDVVTYDQYGNSITNTVTVTITNDAPIARADTGSVTEDASPNTVTGNVITGTGSATADTASADGSTTVVGVAATATGTTLNSSATVGTNITSSNNYGTLNIASDGSYTYTLNNANTTVTALNTGQSLIDVFTYTIKDADGDLSYATVTITINGATDTTASFVVNDVTVNEAAGTMTFTVTNTGAAVTSTVDFTTANNTASSSSDFTAQIGTLSFDASNTTRTITITISNDGVFENSETFYINLSNATGGSIADSQGVGTIKDDGTGNSSNGGTGSGTDDDRALSVNSITVNEGGGYAVFTVSANAGQTMNLALSNGTTNPTATSGTDYTNSLEYWNGSAWVAYSAGFTVPGTTNAAVSLYVRIAITNDTTFENAEDFQLTATYTSGASRSSSGVATIVDDGTGTNYTSGNPTGSGPATNTTSLNDDRALSVNSITVNEGNGTNYAVFNVTANAGQTMTLALSAGTATSGTDYTNALEYWNGSAWTSYSAAFTVPGTTNAQVSLLVRVAIRGDSSYEGAETFSLTAAYASGASRSASGTATIMDDGTGTKFTNGNPTGSTPATDSTNLDDDRTNNGRITVSGLDDVSEGSDAIFTVTLPDGNASGTEISLALSNGTAGSADYSSTFTAYYYNGSTKVDLTITNGKITLPAGVTTFYVSVPTTQDSDLEGAENFSLSATITGGNSASDTSTILDDGTGKIYDTKGLNPSGPGNDDTPTSIVRPPAPPAVIGQPVFVQITDPSILPAAPAGEVRYIEQVYQPRIESTLNTGVHDLRVARNIPDQNFGNASNRLINFAIPADTFEHTNPQASLTMTATQVDGTALPNWLVFDPNRGEFRGRAPDQFVGELVIKILVRDDEGRQAETTVRIQVGAAGEPVSFQGKANLSAQLKQQSVFAWKLERDQLLQRLHAARQAEHSAESAVPELNEPTLEKEADPLAELA